MSGLALTFDDGPDPIWTPRLLDLLADHGVRATFFPIAPRAARWPDVIRRMHGEGHAIGLHCDEHVRHGARDADWLQRDTQHALRRLAALGLTARLWRTPWGEIAPWTPPVAAGHDLRLVGWDVDTHDWRGDDAEMMFAATRDRLVDGAVVLAHDGIGPGARRDDAGETLAYVELVLAHARLHDLGLSPLSS